MHGGFTRAGWQDSVVVRTVSNVMGRDLYPTWLDCTAFSTLMDD